MASPQPRRIDAFNEQTLLRCTCSASGGMHQDALSAFGLFTLRIVRLLHRLWSFRAVVPHGCTHSIMPQPPSSANPYPACNTSTAAITQYAFLTLPSSRWQRVPAAAMLAAGNPRASAGWKADSFVPWRAFLELLLSQDAFLSTLSNHGEQSTFVRSIDG